MSTPISPWMIDEASTPALILDLDRVEASLDSLDAVVKAHGVELFPHAKTHRMAEAGRLQLERGADGLCVAKLGEAEAFADAGARRLIVAYPMVGEDKGVRALALSERVDELTLGTDSVEGARTIGAVFARAGRRARMMIAIDTGLGREGVAPDDAPALAAELDALEGVELVGVYTHEGSAYAASDREALVAASLEVARVMVEAAEGIRALGIPLQHVSMGASATAAIVATVPGVTQVRPGIYAFNDVGQIALGNATIESTGIRVIATVVSHPEPTRACIDAGSKSLGADLVPASAHRQEFPGYGLIVNAPGWAIGTVSEEHGWLRWRGEGEPTALPVGTRLEIIPNHACMAFAMLRRAHVIRGGEAVARWEAIPPGSSE
jgi:D-serine deaminase-like pyridoxal phosphate-dependent protein